MRNLVRLTLVAMATTLALGAESNRLPACLLVGVNVSDNAVVYLKRERSQT